jgi:hypothetical protein
LQVKQLAIALHNAYAITQCLSAVLSKEPERN